MALGGPGTVMGKEFEEAGLRDESGNADLR